MSRFFVKQRKIQLQKSYQSFFVFALEMDLEECAFPSRRRASGQKSAGDVQFGLRSAPSSVEGSPVSVSHSITTIFLTA